MDIEGGERYFLIPFLERHKVCQVMVEVHGRPPVHVSLLSRIAKLNYALYSHDVHPRVPSACEYSFIHLDCMQAYGAYMLKRYLNNVKVPQCSQQERNLFGKIPFSFLFNANVCHGSYSWFVGFEADNFRICNCKSAYV
ncbi:hypothetical protein GCK32_005063 [Trichostrongylus colubriformis]|uniref:Methyltransferase FkbM domain-containing protein n=1 Tax=Trichostrongylus colubriformis TaxID=6319 RepID=A0AAN8EVI9_TRICO